MAELLTHYFVIHPFSNSPMVSYSFMPGGRRSSVLNM